MDLTPEEFAQYKGYSRNSNTTRNIAPYSLGDQHVAAAPTSYDWRTHASVISPVKDQGNCGSCWCVPCDSNCTFLLLVVLAALPALCVHKVCGVGAGQRMPAKASAPALAPCHPLGFRWTLC